VDQFEYVMVLVSIIIGLGITHVLFGVSGLVDRVSRRNAGLELSIAHAAWLGFCLVWMVMFWWWEYRFASRVSEWTIGLYLFLVIYSITLFLMSAILVPRSWEGVQSLKEYFLERRTWFYSLLLLATILDSFDAYLKGGLGYLMNEQGVFIWAYWLASIPVAVVGIRSDSLRVHNFMGILFLCWQILIGFEVTPTLRF
jgi:hypothetical protein